MRERARRAMRAAFFTGTGAIAALYGTTARAMPDGTAFDAAGPPPPPPPAREAPTPDPAATSAQPFRIGALVGVGFPRPVSFEVYSRLGNYVGVGAEYGFLPTLTVDGVYASSWATSVDLRVYPFHGAFFVGARVGYQHIGAGASVTAAQVGTLSASADLDTWFVNPRLGFLWTTRYGLAIGMEAGIQLPVTSSFSTTLPGSTAADVKNSAIVATLSGVLPTVDLLRIGLLF
jgi:hypothetical protein